MLSDSASLILSTKSTINPCSINAQKSSFTFSNIDMKNVMGEMWDKYDQFALKLVSYSTQGTVTVTNTIFGQVAYNMRGLEWSNVIYESTGSNMNKEWVPITYAALTAAVPNTKLMIINTGSSFNFKKGNRNVDLQFAVSAIDYTNASQFGVIVAGNNYPDVDFHFLFEPVIPGKMNECAFFGFNTISTLLTVKRIVSTDRTEYLYPDFNMRRLCNLFWDKHDDFEIQMTMSAMRGTGVNAGDVRITPIQISGLNFVNNGTKQSNNTTQLSLNRENAIIGTIINPTTTSTYASDLSYPVAPVQFKKDNDNVPLRISFRNSENTGPTIAAGYTGTNMPNFLIQFFVKPIYGVEKATLYINPFGLTTTETNLGVRDSSYNTFTLKGIDLRKVCASMWDKYDRFNIFLTNTNWHGGAGNATNASFTLQMEGLDFINQLSLTNTARQTQVAILGSVFSIPLLNDVRTQGTMATLVTSFYKTKDVVDLTLTALPLRPAAPFTSITPLTANFTFTIVGVKQ